MNVSFTNLTDGTIPKPISRKELRSMRSILKAMQALTDGLTQVRENYLINSDYTNLKMLAASVLTEVSNHLEQAQGTKIFELLFTDQIDIKDSLIYNDYNLRARLIEDLLIDPTDYSYHVGDVIDKALPALKCSGYYGPIDWTVSPTNSLIARLKTIFPEVINRINWTQHPDANAYKAISWIDGKINISEKGLVSVKPGADNVTLRISGSLAHPLQMLAAMAIAHTTISGDNRPVINRLTCYYPKDTAYTAELQLHLDNPDSTERTYRRIFAQAKELAINYVYPTSYYGSKELIYAFLIFLRMYVNQPYQGVHVFAPDSEHQYVDFLQWEGAPTSDANRIYVHGFVNEALFVYNSNFHQPLEQLVRGCETFNGFVENLIANERLRNEARREEYIKAYRKTLLLLDDNTLLDAYIQKYYNTENPFHTYGVDDSSDKDLNLDAQ